MSNELLYNELLYVVQGVDHRGRKFAGLYNKEDADYLVKSNRLNRVIQTVSMCDTINASTNERTL